MDKLNVIIVSKIGALDTITVHSQDIVTYQDVLDTIVKRIETPEIAIESIELFWKYAVADLFSLSDVYAFITTSVLTPIQADDFNKAMKKRYSTSYEARLEAQSK